MSFTVQQLCFRMAQKMVKSGMLTQPQLQELLQKTPLVPVADFPKLFPQGVDFKSYWSKLADWLSSQGGNIACSTSDEAFGLKLPPSIPDLQNDFCLAVLLDDCFDAQVEKLESSDFDSIQALACHIQLLRLSVHRLVGLIEPSVSRRAIRDCRQGECPIDEPSFCRHESRITNHESRITNHESRITNHESRITLGLRPRVIRPAWRPSLSSRFAAVAARRSVKRAAPAGDFAAHSRAVPRGRSARIAAHGPGAKCGSARQVI